MKRVFFILSILFILFSTNGCQKKDPNSPDKMHWDRDMCERCKMVVSERKYAVEAKDKNGKSYKFDDIGCLVLWLDEEHPELKGKLKIWITDAKSGKWIDAKSAIYTDDAITPMAYGISAFTKDTFPKGKKPLTFKEACEKIRQIEAINNQKRGIK
jgi:nitrous oxide reductase accessory protein NosL